MLFTREKRKINIVKEEELSQQQADKIKIFLEIFLTDAVSLCSTESFVEEFYYPVLSCQEV